ncbi:MAG: hypothetical protein RLZZ419_11, partial [Pseudomonadota bacterium]
PKGAPRNKRSDVALSGADWGGDADPFPIFGFIPAGCFLIACLYVCFWTNARFFGLQWMFPTQLFALCKNAISHQALIDMAFAFINVIHVGFPQALLQATRNAFPFVVANSEMSFPILLQLYALSSQSPCHESISQNVNIFFLIIPTRVFPLQKSFHARQSLSHGSLCRSLHHELSR